MALSNWRTELGGILGGRARATRAEYENSVFEEFLRTVAMAALNDLAEELNANLGRDAQVRLAPGSATISVRNKATDAEEITFRVMKHFVQNGILPRAEVRLNRGQRLVKYESMFRPDPQTYPISVVTADDIIQCFLRYYRMGMEGNNSVEV